MGLAEDAARFEGEIRDRKAAAVEAERRKVEMRAQALQELHALVAETLPIVKRIGYPKQVRRFRPTSGWGPRRWTQVEYYDVGGLLFTPSGLLLGWGTGSRPGQPYYVLEDDDDLGHYQVDDHGAPGLRRDHDDYVRFEPLRPWVASALGKFQANR